MGQLSEARGVVRSLVVTRAIVTTLLVGVVGSVSLWGRLPFPFSPFLALVGVGYLLNGVYWILIPRVRSPGRLAECQIYADIVLETALIYMTGGLYSVFPFIYLLSILAMSIVVAPRRSLAAATVSVLLHSVLLVLQFYRWLPPMTTLVEPRDVVAEGSLTILLISGNVGASYVVAYLATYLAERLRQARGEVRRTEASLAELTLRHEDIVQSVASGLLTFDRRGTITTVNLTAETLCRRSRDELRGGKWETVFDDAPAFAEAWEALVRRARAPFRFEARLRRRDGSTIPVGVSASFLRRELGLICSFQDLTDIKRMEDRIRHGDRLAAIGRFAAGLAHEIRNPIGSIRGSVEVLRESLQPQGDDRRLMDIILRESDRLDGIITEFLEFSRPQAPDRVEIDLVAILEEILLLLSHQSGTTVRIIRQYSEPTVKARVDPGQIRQALWNLCRNALEAMPRGGELRVSIRREARDPGPSQVHGMVEIAVEDTGIGVTANQLPHVFEPFYTTKPTGTGLGLAIVHRIVKDHAGEIRIESEPGIGTRVSIVLPGEGE